MRIGHGYDVHRLVEGRACIIGGVEIPYTKGLLGHSDADVLTHAIMDALLGAAALGDIGHLFPDQDDAFLNADSLVLLQKVQEVLTQNGWKLGNLDATVIAQAPKMAPHIAAMREKIGGLSANRCAQRQHQGDDGGAFGLYRLRRGHFRSCRVPAGTAGMIIFIDADGCPVVDETVHLANTHHIPCVILCDTSHQIRRTGCTDHHRIQRSGQRGFCAGQSPACG